MVLLVEVVIELYDTVVAVASGCDGAKEIVGGPRQAADQVSRPEPVRPDQFCGQRALGNTVGIQHRQRLIDPGIRRFGGLARQANDVVLFFKTEKVERLVLNDGSAHTATVVLVAQGWSFRNRSRRREEGRRGCVEFIPVEVVSRAV